MVSEEHTRSLSRRSLISQAKIEGHSALYLHDIMSHCSPHLSMTSVLPLYSVNNGVGGNSWLRPSYGLRADRASLVISIIQ